MQLTPEIIEGFVKTILSSRFDSAVETPEFHKEVWGICCSNYSKVAIAAPRN